MRETQTSERMSFWQLLEKYNKIEIPIIQRDYAQGRDNAQLIRKDFLSALRNAIVGERVELDFIYGDVKDGIFRPLDGQQRLTTLFLLHWYAAVRDKRLHEVRDTLGRFGYETRVSSREFCEALVSNDLQLDSRDVAESIRDSNWYYLSWDRDPTIAGMLIMLKEIATRFSDVANLWKKLTTEEPIPITFHFIDLEHFGLSDDLYVKMNARGKQLTPFENFKARFEKRIDEEGWDNDRDLEDSFPTKADNDWLDLFWSHSKESFDNFYIRFIANTLTCSLATDSDRSKNDFELIRDLQNSPEQVSPDTFDKNRYDTLYSWLDLYWREYKDGKDVSNLSINFWDLVPDRQTILSTSLQKPAPRQLVLFYAQTAFLVAHGADNESAYSDWMRVVRNIVQNQAVDQENFVSAISLIKGLLEGATDIYTYLANPETKISSGFASRQMDEERRKALLIVKRGDELKNLLHRAEDTTFCKGHISFALYCAEFSELDPINSVQRDILEETVKVLESDCFSTFDGSNRSDPMRRALLCIGDGNYFKCLWDSWLYAVECSKYRLIPSMEELRKCADHQNCRTYLKELVRQIFQKGVDDIIADHSVGDFPTWRDKIIKQPQLLAFAQEKHIALDEDKGICYLIPRTKVNNTVEGRNKLTKVNSR